MESLFLENEGHYEGCGKEGPIRSIFISEFHHKVGPKIVLQYPPNSISKEIFDTLSPYIIPKTHLQRLIMTVNALGKKIIGYPIQIRNDKYERNAFYFNVCFICDDWAKTVQYEQILIKFAEFLHSLELEIEFLSKIQNEDELLRVFKEVLDGINSYRRECSIIIKDSLLKLKVVQSVIDDPSIVKDYQVPVFIVDVNPIENWDLTTQQIIPYVDGFNHVSKLANLADVDTNLVKTCLQNLVYYRVVKLIPLFQYTNAYCNAPLIHSKLINGDSNFKEECVYFVCRNEHMRPHISDVIRFYLSMKRGLSIKDLCCRFKNMKALPPIRFGIISSTADVRHSSPKFSDYSLSSSTTSNPTTPVKIYNTQPHYQNQKIIQNPSISPVSAAAGPGQQEFQSILSVIDERRLVLFGLVHGLIHRVEKFPLLLYNNNGGVGVNNRSAGTYQLATPNIIQNDVENREHLAKMKHREKYSSIYSMFDGTYPYDEICLVHDLSQTQLDELVETDPDVVIIWK